MLLDSTTGRGTVCECALPLLRVGLAGNAVVAERREAAPFPKVPSGLRILLAEDDTISALVVRRTLEKLGHTVSVANNGREAVDMALADRPDLVFMDVGLPILDGIQAAAEIREKVRQSGGAPIPIIALTAHAMIGDREWLLGAGLDGYLAKPVDRDSLVAVLGTVRPEKGTLP